MRAGLGWVMAALLMAGPVQAQDLRLTPVAQARPAPALQDVFVRARPATVQIEERRHPEQDEPDGAGTAFFISADGLALTAYHVVEGPGFFRARLPGGEQHDLEVIGFDAAADVALLRIRVGQTVPFLPLAGRAPRMGDALVAIGNSGNDFLGARYGQVVQLGVASSRADFPSGTFELNAPLAPGDSGGPILNAQGEVVGIASYIRLSDEGISAYAVPVRSGDPLLADLRSGAQRDVPVIGIFALDAPISPAAFPRLGLGPKPGAVVSEVSKDSPADRAGLRPQRSERDENGNLRLIADVIVAIDGQPTPDFTTLLQLVRSRRIGERVVLTVQRGNQELQIPLVLEGKAQAERRNAPAR